MKGIACCIALSALLLSSAVTAMSMQDIDKSHQTLSQRWQDLANNIDRFFASDPSISYNTDSSLRLGLIQPIERHTTLSPELQIRAELVLPRTEKKFKLLIESDATQSDPNDPTQQSTLIKKNSLSAALRLIIKATETLNIETDAGIKLRLPPEPFLRARIRKTWAWHSWQIRPQQSLGWYLSEGLGAKTYLTLDHPLNEHFLFRSDSSAIWTEQQNEYRLHQGFVLINASNRDEANSLTLFIDGSDQRHRYLTDFGLLLQHRQRFLRPWMFYQLEPRLNYPIESRYRSHLSLLIKLEWVFGQTIS